MTQEVFDYIDSAPGNGFNEKFENIILEAKRGESDRKKELARLDKEIEKQQHRQFLLFEQYTHLGYFFKCVENMQRDFSNLEDRIKDVQLTLGKVEEVEEQIKGENDEQI